MSADINLYSFGPDYNGQVLTEEAQLTGRETARPDWQDTLKYSNKIAGFTHYLKRVYGGTEDCLDTNNGATHITVWAAEWHPQGKYLATIKGGSFGITVNGWLVQHGSEVDVDIGNWSDQSSAKTQWVQLNLRAYDGSPVTVRVLNGDKPVETPGSGPYRYVFPHPDAWYHGICVWWFMTFRRWFK